MGTEQKTNKAKPNWTSKKFNFSDSTVSAFERLKGLNRELSENQIIGRIIRNADWGVAARLHGEALERYKSGELTDEEYQEINSVFFGWHDLPRGTKHTVAAQRASEKLATKRNSNGEANA